MGHSAVLFGDSLITFGGRMSPAQPLADVWALDLNTHTWQRIECKGAPPTARYRHTAVALGSQATVRVFPASLPVFWLVGWLSVRLSVCPSIRLSVRPSVLHVCKCAQHVYQAGCPCPTHVCWMQAEDVTLKLGWTYLFSSMR